MHLLRRSRWLIIVLLLLFSGVLNQLRLATIYVDLSQTGPAALHTGFLHGPAPPVDSVRGHYISELRPQLWRAANAQTLARAPSYGAQPMVLLSDFWGYPLNQWRKRGAVYDHLPAWRKFVETGARANATQPWIWEIWNEPNGHGFFDGSEAQFDQVFIAAARVLRKTLGAQVRISGPSLSHFDLPRLMRFASVCIKAGVKVDVLNWHEFVPAQNAELIVQHLWQAHAQFQNNPKFAALGVKQIMIPETLNSRDWLRPAAIVAYRSAMETGGADAFARACWHESGHSSCWDNSMDGLLVRNGQPRAAWWTERALIPSGPRVYVNTPAHWYAVAQRRSLVLGHLQFDSDALQIKLSGIRTGLAKLPVCIQHIPDSGYDALPELPPQACHRIDVHNGQATLILPAPAVGAALWLRYPQA